MLPSNEVWMLVLHIRFWHPDENVVYYKKKILIAFPRKSSNKQNFVLFYP